MHVMHVVHVVYVVCVVNRVQIHYNDSELETFHLKLLGWIKQTSVALAGM